MAPVANVLTPAVSSNPQIPPWPGKPPLVFQAAVPPRLEILIPPMVPALAEDASRLKSAAALDLSSSWPLPDTSAQKYQSATMQLESKFFYPQAVDAVFGGDRSSFVEENAVDLLIATIDELDWLDY